MALMPSPPSLPYPLSDNVLAPGVTAEAITMVAKVKENGWRTEGEKK